MLRVAGLCCAMVCLAVPRSSVLWLAVLGCAVRCCSVLGCVVLRSVVLGFVVPWLWCMCSCVVMSSDHKFCCQVACKLGGRMLVLE